MLLNAQALVQHANCGEPGGGNTGQLRGKGEAADAINWLRAVDFDLSDPLAEDLLDRASNDILFVAYLTSYLHFRDNTKPNIDSTKDS